MNERQVNYFLKRLQLRRGELVDREARVQRDLERRNEPLSADAPDQAIQLQNDEVLTAIETGALEEIAAIDAALQRLKVKLYGICKRCEAPIPEARLEAIPHATLCAPCAAT